MKLCVLLSCMHQNDASIIERSNIQTDVIVVNQCDEEKIDEYDFINKKGKLCHVKMIYTRERGLSRSRNMAIFNASSDICLISDDDERFDDDYEQKIISAYEDNPKVGFISFACNRKGHVYPKKICKMGIIRILKTSSIQITFKREEILKNNICFDVKMGSGTGNGAGEENKFMIDCRKSGIKMLYYPSVITTLLSNNSQWHNGYNEKYFRNRGWQSKRILGGILGYLYIWVNILLNINKFRSDNLSVYQIVKYFHAGFFENR